MRLVTPTRAVARGIAAGAIGTATMTAWQELSTKLQSPGEDRVSVEAPASGAAEPDPWEHASAPAKVGRKLLEDLFGYEVPPEKIGLLTNVMHWGYGTSWGALYGVLQGTSRGPALRRGLVFGTGVWAMSYVMLVPMGLYEPPWKYSPKELALDVSYHLAYGAGVGAGYGLVDG